MQGLFGTDGIRSKAGEIPLEPEGIKSLSLAYIDILKAEKRKEIVLCTDTRLSAHFISSMLCGFLNYSGINVHLLGVFSTPGVSFYSRSLRIPGISVSASHNPYYDNGLKFFRDDGNKEDRTFETAIENFYHKARAGSFLQVPAEGSMFGINRNIISKSAYYDHIKNALDELIISKPEILDKQKILFDLANGAVSGMKELYSLLSINCDIINDEPDGRNINYLCGSDHIELLKARSGQYDFIFAYDGDGDRVSAMDRGGFIYDGDIIMTLLALYMSRYRNIPKTAAGTVMTSLSAEKALKARGFTLIRSDVGDRNLKDAMDSRGISVGGESSGHIICSDYLPTGDGIFVSLALWHILNDPFILGILPGLREDFLSMARKNTSFSLAKRITPDELYSLIRRDFSNLDLELVNNSVIIRYSDEFYSVVRLSGTEPRIRVFAESINSNYLQNYYDKLLYLFLKYDIIKD